MNEGDSADIVPGFDVWRRYTPFRERFFAIASPRRSGVYIKTYPMEKNGLEG